VFIGDAGLKLIHVALIAPPGVTCKCKKQVMETTNQGTITVHTTVNAPIEKVWECFTKPAHISHWNFASDEWHAPAADNDLREGGKFVYRMEAKDGSMGFDFWGIYEVVRVNEYLQYVLGDDRQVKIEFKETGNGTEITETFEPEQTNTIELQRGGWQAILDNFKRYTESL
jgi:uncharacterized protein YndB with AHSA1/START domain